MIQHRPDNFLNSEELSEIHKMIGSFNDGNEDSEFVISVRILDSNGVEIGTIERSLGGNYVFYPVGWSTLP